MKGCSLRSLAAFQDETKESFEFTPTPFPIRYGLFSFPSLIEVNRMNRCLFGSWSDSSASLRNRAYGRSLCFSFPNCKQGLNYFPFTSPVGFIASLLPLSVKQFHFNHLPSKTVNESKLHTIPFPELWNWYARPELNSIKSPLQKENHWISCLLGSKSKIRDRIERRESRQRLFLN